MVHRKLRHRPVHDIEFGVRLRAFIDRHPDCTSLKLENRWRRCIDFCEYRLIQAPVATNEEQERLEELIESLEWGVQILVNNRASLENTG